MKILLVMLTLAILTGCGGGGDTQSATQEPTGPTNLAELQLIESPVLLGETTCDVDANADGSYDFPNYGLLIQDGDQYTVNDAAGNIIAGPFTGLEGTFTFSGNGYSCTTNGIFSVPVNSIGMTAHCTLDVAAPTCDYGYTGRFCIYAPSTSCDLYYQGGLLSR